MYFTLTSSTTSLIPPPLLFPSHQNSTFNISSFTTRNNPALSRRRRFRSFAFKSSHKTPNPSPLCRPSPLPILTPIEDASKTSTLSIPKLPKPPPNDTLSWVSRQISLTLFCIVVGLCCPFFPSGFRLQAVAAPSLSEVLQKRTKKSDKKTAVLKQKEHEYSDCTRRLLETVSELIRSIEEVRLGNLDVEAVEVSLREVKSKKRELQEEIMNGMYAELRELKAEEEKLIERSEEILAVVLKAKREQESLLRKGSGGGKGEGVKERIGKLEEEMHNGEKEYNVIWEKVGEIRDRIAGRETMALSIGVRELLFIERESELLVEKFRREVRRQSRKR